MVAHHQVAAFAFPLLLCAAAPLRAQGAVARDSMTQMRDETARRRPITVWAAGARNQALQTRAGSTHDRDLYLIGLRVAWPLIGRRGDPPFAQLEYVMEIIPLVVSTNMPKYATEPLLPSCPTSGPCAYAAPPVEQRTAFGAGLTPLGLALHVGSRPVGLVVRGGAGVVYFSHAVPDPEEPRRNFTLDLAAALETRVSPWVMLTVGYRFNHLSNAGRGPVNPGMNSHMLEVGATRAR